MVIDKEDNNEEEENSDEDQEAEKKKQAEEDAIDKYLDYEAAVDLAFDNEDDKNELKELLPYIYEKVIYKVYDEIQALFTDPKGEGYYFGEGITRNSMTYDNIEKYTMYSYFGVEKAMMFNMGFATTMNILRKAYWDCGLDLP